MLNPNPEQEQKLRQATSDALRDSLGRSGTRLWQVERDRFGIMFSGPLEIGEMIEVVPVGRALREIVMPVLASKLADMELHDDTGDPHDEGYMAAINELREWMEHGGET